MDRMRIIDDPNDSDDEPVPAYVQTSRPGRGGRKGKQKGGPFREDLKKLMYGYGDDFYPNDSTVDLLAVYVEEFVINMVA